MRATPKLAVAPSRHRPSRLHDSRSIRHSLMLGTILGTYWTTKDALQAAKARGVVLGNPKLDAVRDRAVASVRADADRFAKNVAPIIHEIQSSGVASHRAIARSLNARGVATARGGQWTAVQVGSILRRVVTDVPC